MNLFAATRARVRAELGEALGWTDRSLRDAAPTLGLDADRLDSSFTDGLDTRRDGAFLNGMTTVGRVVDYSYAPHLVSDLLQWRAAREGGEEGRVREALEIMDCHDAETFAAELAEARAAGSHPDFEAALAAWERARGPRHRARPV
jgi:hypothetical protein